MTVKKDTPSGYAPDPASGILVKREDLDSCFKLQDDADAMAAARREVTGQELETFAYEFRGSDGHMNQGLALGGIEYLYDHHFKRNEPQFGDPHVEIGDCPQEETRVFTVAIICMGPDGRRTVGISSQQERPCKHKSTQRYFDKFAASKALSCAKRNAMRDQLPKVIRKKFLKEVLDAKHGVGRVEVLENRRRKQIEGKVVADWGEVNVQLHKIARDQLKLNIDGFHALMCRSETKAMGRKIERYNRIPVQRLRPWVALLKKAQQDPAELAKLQRNVARLTPAQPKKRGR